MTHNKSLPQTYQMDLPRSAYKWRASQLHGAGVPFDAQFEGGQARILIDAADVPAAESAMATSGKSSRKRRSMPDLTKYYGVIFFGLMALGLAFFVPTGAIVAGIGAVAMALFHLVSNAWDNRMISTAKRTNSMPWKMMYVADGLDMVGLFIAVLVVIFALGAVASARTGIPMPWEVMP